MELEQTQVQKLARVLKVLVMIAFVCNIVALLLVPFLVYERFHVEFGMILATFAYDFDDGLAVFFDTPLYQVWQEPYTAVLTVFLWLCGICTAVILWQAKRVLNTILAGTPFSSGNAANMRQAAVCCLVTTAAALARLIWGFCYYQSIAPLLTYNALFVPVFAMGFLLCMVMSALFRQAAELKAENDLTI